MGFEPSQLPDLSGRIYLVTGGNAGIGKETVRQLAGHHAKVYLAARSEAKASAAIDDIRASVPSADIHFLKLDMMDLSSVAAATKDFLNKETKLHGLVNNAGIMAVPFAESMDGYESQFQTNYLSHWLFTKLLLPVLSSTAANLAPGAVRIINITSNGHSLFSPKKGIDFEDINQVSGTQWTRYGMSKLANILHAKELHKIYGPKSGTRDHQVAGNTLDASTGEIWTASVHPGSVDTDLNKNSTGFAQSLQPILRCLNVYCTPEQGAYTSLFAIASPDFKSGDSGEYFTPIAKKSKPSSHARNAELAKKLWDWTEAELKSKGLI